MGKNISTMGLLGRDQASSIDKTHRPERLVSVAPPSVPLSAACGVEAVPWDFGKMMRSWLENTKQRE